MEATRTGTSMHRNGWTLMEPTGHITNPHADLATIKLSSATKLREQATAEQRDFSPEEERLYDGLLTSATKEADRAASYRTLEQRLEGYRSTTGPTVVKPMPMPPLETRSATPGKRETAVLVPSLAQYRAQAEGTDGAGGYLVPVEQAPVVVERLAPQSVLLTAGPRLFTMSSDEMRVPKIATGATVSMVAENAEITASDIVFEAAALVARKLAGLVRASNEWLSDAIPDARTVVEQNLMRELGIKLDQQFFVGDGTPPNLSGILDWSGVTATPGTASLDDLAAAIARVEAAFAAPNAIFLSPENWAAVRAERVDGATGAYHLQPDTSAAARPVIFGVPVYITPHVGDSIIVADMRYIAVGVRDRWNVHYDPYRYSEFDQSAIRVTSRWAIAPLHVEAVQVITVGES